MAPEPTSQLVQFGERRIQDGRCLMIATLNAPRMLNALSLEMIRSLQRRLDDWAEDPRVAAVWLQGAGDRAFCAGGDLLALYRAMTEPKVADGDAFFTEEYRLDYSIHTFPKPLLVWGQGVIMGGGLGLMAGAHFRVVTETAHIAMPEIGIGLFPDVGAGWFLNRMPGRTGLFLGTTGAGLNAADALHTGLADHFVNGDQHDALLDALTSIDWSLASSDSAAMDKVLRDFELASKQQLPSSRVREYYHEIQALTDADSPQSLMDKLTAYDGDSSWLSKAVESVNRGSPTSFALCFEQLRRARTMSLEQVFDQELVMAANCLRAGEFAEGVRALLVDKDKQPRWRFARLADMDTGWIHGFFVPPWPNRN